MRRLNVALIQTRGRALTRIAFCCFAEKRRWYEYLPLVGDNLLRRRLRGKWRPEMSLRRRARSAGL